MYICDDCESYIAEDETYEVNIDMDYLGTKFVNNKFTADGIRHVCHTCAEKIFTTLKLNLGEEELIQRLTKVKK